MQAQHSKQKPNKGEVYMYVNLFWLAVASFVFIPILNNFILQLIILFTSGNKYYGSLPETIATVRDIIGAAANYIGLGVFATCLLNFGKNAFGVKIAAFASHGITFCVSMLAYALYDGESAVSAFLVFGMDAVFNLAVYGIIYLAVMAIAKKKETFLNLPPYSVNILNLKHPLSLSYFITSVIYGGISIIVVLITMITDFLDPSLGPPVSTTEIIHWVMQYLTPILSAVIGYFLMLFVGGLAEKYKRHFK